MTSQYFIDLCKEPIQLDTFHPTKHAVYSCQYAPLLGFSSSRYKQRRSKFIKNADKRYCVLEDTLKVFVASYYGLHTASTIAALTETQVVHASAALIQRQFRLYRARKVRNSIDPAFRRQFLKYLLSIDETCQLDKDQITSEADLQTLQNFMIKQENVSNLLKLLTVLNAIPTSPTALPYKEALAKTRKLFSALIFTLTPSVLFSNDSPESLQIASLLHQNALQFCRLSRAILKLSLDSLGAYKVCKYLQNDLKQSVFNYLSILTTWQTMDKVSMRKILADERIHLDLMKAEVITKAKDAHEAEAVEKEYREPLEKYDKILSYAEHILHSGHFASAALPGIRFGGQTSIKEEQASSLSNAAIGHALYLYPHKTLFEIFELLGVVKVPDLQQSGSNEIPLPLNVTNIGLHLNILREIYARLLETLPGKVMGREATYECDIDIELNIHTFVSGLEDHLSRMKNDTDKLSIISYSIRNWLQGVLEYMKKLCCPVRDAFISELTTLIRDKPSEWYKLYQSFLDVLIVMHYDLVAFMTEAIRPALLGNLKIAERAAFDLKFPTRATRPMSERLRGQIVDANFLLTLILLSSDEQLPETFYLDVSLVENTRRRISNLAKLSAFTMQAEKQPNISFCEEDHFMASLDKHWDDAFLKPRLSNEAFALFQSVRSVEHPLHKLYLQRVGAIVKNISAGLLSSKDYGVPLPMATGQASVRRRPSMNGMFDELKRQLGAAHLPKSLVELSADELEKICRLLSQLIKVHLQVYNGFIYSS
jgi:T-complex protein 11